MMLHSRQVSRRYSHCGTANGLLYNSITDSTTAYFSTETFQLFPAVAQITAKLSNLAALNPLMPTLKLHSNVLLYSNTVIATLAVDYYYYYYYYKRKD